MKQFIRDTICRKICLASSSFTKHDHKPYHLVLRRGNPKVKSRIICILSRESVSSRTCVASDVVVCLTLVTVSDCLSHCLYGLSICDHVCFSLWAIPVTVCRSLSIYLGQYLHYVISISRQCGLIFSNLRETYSSTFFQTMIGKRIPRCAGGKCVVLLFGFKFSQKRWVLTALIYIISTDSLVAMSVSLQRQFLSHPGVRCFTASFQFVISKVWG